MIVIHACHVRSKYRKEGTALKMWHFLCLYFRYLPYLTHIGCKKESSQSDLAPESSTVHSRYTHCKECYKNEKCVSILDVLGTD